jgi:hypothetical protein
MTFGLLWISTAGPAETGKLPTPRLFPKLDRNFSNPTAHLLFE